MANESGSDNEDIPVLVSVQPTAKDLIGKENNNNSNEEHERHKLLLRREIRRKKVLDNAKERLAKLNGREPQPSNGRSVRFMAQADVSDPEVEPDIPFTMGAHNFTSRNTEPMPAFDLSGLLTPNEIRVPKLWQKCRLHVVLAAIITCALHILGYTSITGFSIFTLFGMAIAYELLFCTRQKQMDPMVNLLMMFSGIQPKIINNMLNFVFILFNVFTDVGIFIFCFCSFLIISKRVLTNEDVLNLIETK